MTSARLRYVSTLGVAAALILIVGWFFKPASESGQGAEPSDLDLAQIAQIERRFSIDDVSQYFSEVADRVAPSLSDLGQPGLIRDSAVRRGEWLVAVWRTAAGHAFASGHFVDLRTVQHGLIDGRLVASTVPLDAEMVGGGLFDLDGHLVGVISEWQGSVAALTPATLAAINDEAQSVAGQLRMQYDLGVGAMTPDEEAVLGAESDGALVVREVGVSSPASRAGLIPGDVIVQIDGRAAGTAEDFLAALSAPGDAELVVRWKKRPRPLRLPDAGVPEPSGIDVDGLGVDLPAGGIVIDRVEAGSRAEQAGVRSGDRLLSVNRIAIRDSKQLTSLLRAPTSPAFVVVQRRDRLIGLVFASR